MKKIFLGLAFIFAFSAGPFFIASAHSATWKPVAPDGYAPITWAKAPGIATFFKAPAGNGTIDFITRIYLPQNQIGFIASTSTPRDWGVADPGFASTATVPDSVLAATTSSDPFSVDVATTTSEVNYASGYHNYAFSRIVAETAKRQLSTAQFIWNAPFFNITNSVSDLSMALKYTAGTTTIVSTGSRPPGDMMQGRRMLVVNNLKGTAIIQDFDSIAFVSSSIGDQGFEGFAPDVAINDNASGAAARLFLGIATSSKELVVYCSQQATVREASNALLAAGVPVERQLQADGGGSASCGYNLPGQFFVEPTRTLPLLMGASTLLGRGNPTTDGLNVRSGPSTKNPIVMKLDKKTMFRIFEEKNGWYRIGEGQWVKMTLVKKI